MIERSLQNEQLRIWKSFKSFFVQSQQMVSVTEKRNTRQKMNIFCSSVGCVLKIRVMHKSATMTVFLFLHMNDVIFLCDIYAFLTNLALMLRAGTRSEILNKKKMEGSRIQTGRTACTVHCRLKTIVGKKWLENLRQ